jgi:hypothetical protein
VTFLNEPKIQGVFTAFPVSMGLGVGRVLYRHVMEEAGRLGFTQVRIEPDPNAEGFYLAMGAERQGTGRALPVLVAWPVRPEPTWSVAWSAGGRAPSPDTAMGR